MANHSNSNKDKDDGQGNGGTATKQRPDVAIPLIQGSEEDPDAPREYRVWCSPECPEEAPKCGGIDFPKFTDPFMRDAEGKVVIHNNEPARRAQMGQIISLRPSQVEKIKDILNVPVSTKWVEADGRKIQQQVGKVFPSNGEWMRPLNSPDGYLFCEEASAADHAMPPMNRERIAKLTAKIAEVAERVIDPDRSDAERMDAAREQKRLLDRLKEIQAETE